MKILIRLLILLALASPASAQQAIVAATLPITGTIDASNPTVTLAIPPGRGYATLGVEATGTWAGTIAVQCAVRNRQSAADFTYQAIRLTPYNSATAVTSFTANGSWSGGIGGCSRVIATYTSWTSGSAVITLNAVSLGGSGGGGGGGSGGTVDQGTSPWIVAPATGAFATDGTFGDASPASGPAIGVRASATVPTAVDADDLAKTWGTLNGAVVTATVDPCSRGTKVTIPISQATSTELFTGTASNRTFVCSVSIIQISTATQTWSLVSGTGSVCGTSTSGMIGATTAANGTDLSVTQGNGAAWILKTDTDADNVCLLQSSTTRINGHITYVVAPNQ